MKQIKVNLQDSEHVTRAKCYVPNTRDFISFHVTEKRQRSFWNRSHQDWWFVQRKSFSIVTYFLMSTESVTYCLSMVNLQPV